MVGAGPVAPAAAASAAAKRAAPSPHRFVDVAASAALYAVEAAKLAERRARNPRLRSLAKLQKDGGFGIGGQLSWAGRRVNALPDNVLTPEHQRMLDALKRARNFDALYLAQQQQLVPTMRAFHEDYAVRGGSATLRPVAQFSARKMAAQQLALARLD
nr:DUF4142 domain-containing protein [Sphingomicrobium astaxanthinifaciens]